MPVSIDEMRVTEIENPSPRSIPPTQRTPPERMRSPHTIPSALETTPSVATFFFLSARASFAANAAPHLSYQHGAHRRVKLKFDEPTSIKFSHGNNRPLAIGHPPLIPVAAFIEHRLKSLTRLSHLQNFIISTHFLQRLPHQYQMHQESSSYIHFMILDSRCHKEAHSHTVPGSRRPSWCSRNADCCSSHSYKQKPNS